jgi:hypothetical protein
MPRAKSIRADKLLRQLASDPEHVVRQRERERRSAQSLRKCTADEAELVAQLRSAGFLVASVQEYVASGGAPVGAVPILVSHLDQPHDPRIWETIVRALSVRHAHDAALPRLSQLYSAEKDPDRRWILANAIGAMAKLREVRHLPGIDQYHALFRQSYKPAHVAPVTLTRRCS